MGDRIVSAADADSRVTVFTPESSAQPIGPYLRALWARHHFIQRHSAATLAKRYGRSALGTLWNLLNPLLLASVYVFLFTVLRPGSDPVETTTHVVFGIFFYYFTLNSVLQGARSVLSEQQLVMNASFPLLALPLSAVTVALRQLVAASPILVICHLVSGRPIGVSLLLLLPLFALQILLNVGLAALGAASLVRVPDIGNALPYLMRLLLYVTPVLYSADLLPKGAAALLVVNPLAPLFVLLDDLLHGEVGEPLYWLATTGWTIFFLVVGVWFFRVSERQFASAV